MLSALPGTPGSLTVPSQATRPGWLAWCLGGLCTGTDQQDSMRSLSLMSDGCPENTGRGRGQQQAQCQALGILPDKWLCPLSGSQGIK